MRLQYALTMNDPKSVDAAALQTSGGGTGLNKADILTALGLLQGRERAGLALMYAKYTKDKGESMTAADLAGQFGESLAPQIVGNDKCSAVIGAILGKLAVVEYCRTPDTPGAMCRCGGSGLVADTAALNAMASKPSAPALAMTKPCDRCRGTGMRPLPVFRVFSTVQAFAPEVTKSTFYRKWQPLYLDMLNWCYEQEGRAEVAYKRLTRSEAA